MKDKFCGLIDFFTNTEASKKLISGLQRGEKDQLGYGISGSGKALFAASLIEQGYRVLVVTANGEEAKKIYSDLETLLTETRVGYFPAREIMPYEVYAHSNELQNQRLGVMKRLVLGELACVVAPVGALLVSLVPHEVFAQSLLTLQQGDTLELDQVTEWLVEQGYERVDRVENAGQFSVRGGILDVYPVDEQQPVRVEFWGEDVDSIRCFDVSTQRSQTRVDKVVLGPARELVLTQESRERGKKAIEAEFAMARKKLVAAKNNRALDRLNEKVGAALDKVINEQWAVGLEQFHSFFYPDGETLIDYFPSPVIIWDEMGRIEEETKRLSKERADTYSQLLMDGALLPSQSNNYLQLERLLEQRCHGRIYLSLLPKGLPLGIQPQQVVNFETRTVQSFLGKMDLLAQELRQWLKKKYRLLLLTADQDRAKRLQLHLWDSGVEVHVSDGVQEEPRAGVGVIVWPSLHQGFQLAGEKLVVVTDHELYGQKRQGRKTFKQDKKLDVFRDLKVGDYIVHINHGVGRYLGIERLEVGGVYKDYLHIQYAGEDKLYLPTDQAALIQPYTGVEGYVPKLNKLGGNEWKRVKKRVKQSVEDLAKDLLALYAARETVKGFAFPPDSDWQKDFEAQFPYQETEDQLTAIEEVKADMEKPKPMDRLLVGDVGYGKTEVAMRAAFKACDAGKQVAVLVPTTVLAQQHYLTFTERFKRFPMKIAVLSRFTGKAEQKAIVKGLAEGTVDIVIGTHRLLSSDVRFKDLGLLVIDEEQRFGVKHKERLKELRHQVDVLTLSATPIPRTLHMSLVGVRDMSVIETPPEERYPVQTYVVEYSPELVQEAVYRELNRQGQVFYVYNRVQGLQKKASEIQRLVPEARIAVAHGQMPERKLEQVMLDFIEGRYDVLVCTTIVENGLDIQNANTLIVDEADRMGLSQLYQIRGRVGRTNRVAYAYLTYRKDKVLSADAEKRLAAIREFTELGSGFKIAMRDLEIRGAGNILGPEQHGHMLAVGFDLYCRLLEDAVKRLKGEKQETAAKEPPSLELTVDAYIADRYIADPGEKIDFYRRLTNAGNLAEVEGIAQALEDRYGKFPGEVENLLALARLRVLGMASGVTKIKQVSADRAEIHFGDDVKITGEKLMNLAQQFPRRVGISVARGITLQVKISRLDQRKMLELLESILYKTKALVED
ncbi:MAG: transcription-repair coupling factor [Thermoanaerobacteraceae bacterium]|nr:transcription-repair coupling factor [Thermoanaerobacteraceae bacterium]